MLIDLRNIVREYLTLHDYEDGDDCSDSDSEYGELAYMKGLAGFYPKDPNRIDKSEYCAGLFNGNHFNLLRHFLVTYGLYGIDGGYLFDENVDDEQLKFQLYAVKFLNLESCIEFAESGSVSKQIMNAVQKRIVKLSLKS
jgi:hypothetical protein